MVLKKFANKNKAHVLKKTILLEPLVLIVCRHILAQIMQIGSDTTASSYACISFVMIIYRKSVPFQFTYILLIYAFKIASDTIFVWIRLFRYKHSMQKII